MNAGLYRSIARYFFVFYILLHKVFWTKILIVNTTEGFFKDPSYKAVAVLSIISVNTLLMIFATTASFVSNNSHTVYATGENTTQSSSPSTAKTNDVSTIIAAVTAVAAIAAIIFGLIQYGKGQTTQRQRVLFELVKELNDSPDMKLAKEILGYGLVNNPNENWRHEAEPGYYCKQRLTEFLVEKRLDDPGALEIRNSFDSFIVFLGKIGYSLKVGAIKRSELVYFHYYIRKTIDTPEVTRYIARSQFPLYFVLLREATTQRRLKGLSKRLPTFRRYVSSYFVRQPPKDVLRAYRHFTASDDIELADLMTEELKKYVDERKEREGSRKKI